MIHSDGRLCLRYCAKAKAHDLGTSAAQQSDMASHHGLD